MSTDLVELAQALGAEKLPSGEDYDFKAIEVPQQSVLVSRGHQIRGGNWKNVAFEMSGESSLTLSQCVLHGASIHSTAGVPTSSRQVRACPQVHISGGVVDKCSISGSFRSTRMDSLNAEGLVCDTTTDELKIEHCVFHSSRFKDECNHISFSQVEMFEGEWTPDVRFSMDLHKVRFIRTKIDIATIINHCDERSTIDVHQASISDRWAELRNYYTGGRLVFVLLLTLAFILPYLAKTAYLVIIAKAQDGVFAGSGTEIPLWQALLVGHRVETEAFWYGALGISLIYYNVVRFLLTMVIARMREREEHLQMYGFSRVRPNEGTKFFDVLWFLHKIQTYLLNVVILTALWRVYEAMSIRLRWF